MMYFLWWIVLGGVGAIVYSSTLTKVDFSIDKLISNMCEKHNTPYLYNYMYLFFIIAFLLLFGQVIIFMEILFYIKRPYFYFNRFFILKIMRDRLKIKHPTEDKGWIKHHARSICERRMSIRFSEANRLVEEAKSNTIN